LYLFLKNFSVRIREENIRLIFGLKIKQLRIEKNLSLAELSQRSGISLSYINEIEKGKKYPKGDKIVALANALEVEYDWLVSLQLNKTLAPIAELLQSNILSELPLEMFDIDLAELLELLSKAPAKLSAFISTLLEISRHYGMSVEQFFFAVLRSYQEMYQNYFEDLEQQAEAFAQMHGLQNAAYHTAARMEELLVNKFGYTIQENGLSEDPDLASLRSVLTTQNGQPVLLLNKNLGEKQKTFTLAREIGYQFMQIKERPLTFSWVEVDSFEQVLNNFKASYFASALLIPKQSLLKDLEAFFSMPAWDSNRLVSIMEQYQATPEMFLHRLTNLLPRFFGMDELFFLRFNHTVDEPSFYLTKEMHLSGLHNPHANTQNEHYCRRWISLTVLEELDVIQKQNTYTKPVCGAQISNYIGSENKYLVIAMARPMAPTPNLNSSVSIGLLLNDEIQKKISFLQDPNLLRRAVNETCERCSALDCQERAAPPTVLKKQEKIKIMKQSLAQLTQGQQNVKK
jgi:XRE family transcriptional regulator, fatty acid utilization regulator